MKKRITKRNWYGDELENGKAKVPSIAPDDERHLDGINRGEIKVGDNAEDPTIFIRDNKGNIVGFRPSQEIDLEELAKTFLRKDHPERTDFLMQLFGGLEVKGGLTSDSILVSELSKLLGGVEVGSPESHTSISPVGDIETPNLKILNSLRIGDGEITWDAVNSSFKVAGFDGTAAGIYASGGMASKGFSPGSSGGGGSGASALYQLMDVIPNASNSGVEGAVSGSVLKYDGSKWYAGEGLDTNALSAYLSTNNYATKGWVSDKGYALQSSLNVVSGKLDNFLSGEGISDTIDNWKEFQKVFENFPDSSNMVELLRGKVDKVDGMGLSQNSFTTTLLNKLNGIAEGANKYILPVAKAAILGGVMVGSTLSADASGVLNLKSASTAGTYTKVAVDTYGRVTSGSSLLDTDIPTLAIGKVNGLQSALDGKLEASIFSDMFEKVNIGTSEKPIYGIKAKYGLYTDTFLSSKGRSEGQGGGSGGLDETLLWSILANTGTEQIAKNHLTTALSGYALSSSIPSLTGYATESWVNGKGYLIATAAHKANWDAAFSWGNHTLAGYLKAHQTIYGFTIKAGTTAVSVFNPVGAANEVSIIAGSNIAVTADAANKKMTIANTYSYTHPSATATTIAAASGRVLSAITVNGLGHVTSVSSKDLASGDIPTLAISKISGLQTALDSKLNESVFTDLFEKVNIGTTAAPVWSIRAKYGLWTETFLSSKGNSHGSGGGGASFDRLDAWGDYTDDKAGYVLSAGLGYDLHTRVSTLELRPANVTVKLGTVAYNAVGGVVSLPAYPTDLAWGSITGKPTTLGDYGITDAKIVNGVITLGSSTLTPVTSLSGYATEAFVTGKGYLVATAADKANWNTAFGWGNHASAGYAKATALNSYILTSQKGVANGVAPLGADSKIAASYLPSYVDDVLEYANRSGFPATGESGKIYIAIDTNLTYRWGGTAYTEISQSLALGETASTAYAGNKGAANASAITALGRRTISAGAGLTGGGDLTANRSFALSTTGVVIGTYTKVKVDSYGRVTGASNIAEGDLPAISIAKITNLQETLNDRAFKTISVSAGNGLTGGGTLAAAMTFNVASANDGISVNADNIQLNAINNLSTASTTKPLSAAQGKVIWDFVTDLFEKVNIGTASAPVWSIKAKYGLWTEAFLSSKGYLQGSGGGGGGLDEAMLWSVLGNNGNEQIAKNHLTDALSTYVVTTDARLSDARKASDVYSWAKAAAKPGYSYGEISGTPPAVDLSNYVTLNTTQNITGTKTLSGNTILHSANYNNYVPAKTGVGASGTWGINITGNAATATASSTANTLSSTRYLWGNWFNGSNNVENSLYIQQAPTTNATGVFWRNLAHSAIIAGIGTHTVGDGLVGLYMGWGNEPWQPPYCLFVNSENIRYKTSVIWHAGNHGSGSGLNADMLDGHHADAFLGSSIYNYTLGYLVTLAVDATENAMMVVSIKGNSYGSVTPIDTTIEFYNYNTGNVILNSGCIHNGLNFGAISVFNYNGRVCIWFTQGNASFRSFIITAVQTNSSSSINRVENITNTAKPTEGVTREVVVFARTSALLTDNVASATKLQTARIIFGQSFDGTGDITGRMTASDIELYAATPFIDFHHGSSTTDYTSRLITTDATTLNCTSNFSVGGNIYGLGTVRGTAVNNTYNQGSFEARGNGNANTVKPSYGFHQPGVYGGRLVQESENEFSFYNTSGVRANLNISELHANGRSTMNSLSCGYTNTTYNLSVASFIINDWCRTIGNVGWYNVTHNGGIYMIDTTWVRIYGGKAFFVGNNEPGSITTAGGISCNGITNSGNIITAGNIHSSSGTISAGEGVYNTYGFINVTRPDGTGTNWTQSCFSMVRQGKSPFGIGFNGNNSILLGGATTQKTINSWIEINSSYTSADNIRALSSLRIGANDVVNGTTTITSTNAGAVFNTLGTTFGFNKPVYITGGLDLIDMLTIDNRIVANVKCAIKADRTAMSYSTESASHSFNKKITVTGDILVSANDIYNLGSSTNRFNIGYIKTLASNAISTSSLSTDTFNVYTGANISGYVIINNNITISGQADINKLIMPYSAGAWINMAYSSAISGKIPTSTSSAHVLYRLIDSGGNAIAFGGLGTSLGFYGFYKSTISAGTNTYNWRTYWDTSNGIFVQEGDMFIGDGRNGAYLQIGNMRLAYDQANNAMKLTNGASGVANFYSMGGMSSKGSSSDIRLKKDLTQYDALDIIRGHRSLMYHWNDTAKANSEIFRTDKWQFGLIAQDLINSGYGQLTSDIFKDYLIIDYERLIPIVWRGVQQVDNEVTILKKRISNLEKELEQLKKQSA